MGLSLLVKVGSAATGGAGNATGSIAPVSVSAVSGLATGAAVATALLTSILVSPAEAVAGGSGSAIGSISPITVSTISGTATGSATASGIVQEIVTSAAGGIATARASASGDVANILTTPVTGSSSGQALGSGSLANVAISPVDGSADAGGSGTGSGSLAGITITPADAIGSGASSTSGEVSNISVVAVDGSAAGEASGVGAVPSIGVSSTAGGASGRGSGTGLVKGTNVSPTAGTSTGAGAGSASISNVFITAASGSASSGSGTVGNATGTIAGITVSAVTGSASTGAGITVREILTKLYQDTHTAEEVGTEVWQHPTAIDLVQDIGFIDKAVHVNTEQVTNGDGSQANPFNNLDDTLTFAEAKGYKLIHVLADITIDRNLKNFVVTGVGSAIAIDCNGYDLNKTRFQYCTMRGQYSGSIIVQDSVLDDGFYLNGFFNNCVLNGDLYCVTGSKVLIMLCSSFVQGEQQPSISMVASGTCELGVRFYSGGFELRDMNNIGDKCSIEPVAGAITLASSCTSSAGSLSLKGNASLVNNSTIVNLDNKLFNPLAVWNHTQ